MLDFVIMKNKYTKKILQHIKLEIKKNIYIHAKIAIF